MSDLDKRVRDAFDEIQPPEGLNGRTLEFIRSRDLEPRNNESGVSSIESNQESSAKKSKGKSRSTTIFRKSRTYLAVAACVCLAAIGVGGYAYAYATPTAYVDIEDGYTVQLSVNRFDVVVAATASDPRGESLLDAGDVIGKSYSDALSSIMSYSNSEGDGTYSVPSTSIVCDDATQSDQLYETTRNCMHGSNADSTHSMTHEENHERRSYDMSAYEYTKAKELIALDPELTLEDCSEMTIEEIEARIDELSDSSESDSGYSKRSEGSDAGSGYSGSGGDHGDSSHHGHNGNRYRGGHH